MCHAMRGPFGCPMTPEVLASLPQEERAFWDKLNELVLADFDVVLKLSSEQIHEPGVREVLHSQLTDHILLGIIPRLEPSVELREAFVEAVNDHNGLVWCHVKQLLDIFDWEDVLTAIGAI